jgi:hypothetical protein
MGRGKREKGEKRKIERGKERVNNKELIFVKIILILISQLSN